MSQRNVYQKLGYKISEEVQLLAEEKWILDALAKIKKQRNCLQIERLHLESLKTKIKGGHTKRDIPETITKIDNENEPTTSAVNLMQTVTGLGASEKVEKRFSLEESCNDEELNLMVTQPVFSKNIKSSDFNMEEDEEESDDDMFIDMNMLMNGLAK